MDEFSYQEQFIEVVIGKTLGLSTGENRWLKEELVPIGQLNFQRVVEIYANDYKWRLIDTLKANFKSLWRLLGDERFESLAFSYVKRYPSTSPDLNEYGAFFPNFLCQSHEMEKELALILKELGDFELSFSKVFHAKEKAIEKREAILGEEIMDYVFRADESVALLSFHYDVFSLFSSEEKKLEDLLNKVSTPSAYLLHKKNSKVFCQSLTSAELAFFRNLMKGEMTLGEAILSETMVSRDEIQHIFLLIGSHFLPQLKRKRVDE